MLLLLLVTHFTVFAGATELICGLETYMQSVVTTSDTQVFVLDCSSIDRLIYKPRVTSTIDALVDGVDVKLRARLVTPSGDQVCK